MAEFLDSWVDVFDLVAHPSSVVDHPYSVVVAVDHLSIDLFDEVLEEDLGLKVV